MNDLDMELQTIRQKLKTLKASPPEAMSAPWSPSRLTAPSPDLAQVTTAIETLRQRSGQTLPAPVASASLQQFDTALNTINQLAQQQHQALARLHSLGSSLVQHVQPGTSPDIDDIAHFLTENPAIQVPTVQRDADGYLSLNYHTVDFYQTKRGASEEVRSHLFKHSFSKATRSVNAVALDESPYDNTNLNNPINDLKQFWQITSQTLRRWASRRMASAERPRNSHFTALDGAIWCIGAVIGRLILNQIFQFYPTLWTPIAFALIAGIIFTLYRAILSPRPNPTVGYRTLMIIVGLLVGGRFS